MRYSSMSLLCKTETMWRGWTGEGRPTALAGHATVLGPTVTSPLVQGVRIYISSPI